MRVLMVGVDRQTKGGMWTVVENYLNSEHFIRESNLRYIPTAITGSIPKRLWFTAKALFAIIKELIGKKYDLVHVHMSERGSVYRKNLVIILAKCFGCKVIIHMHGAEFEDWYQKQTEFRRAGIRKILNRADKVLILGKYWETFVESLLEDKKNLEVLYNAVPVPEENQYCLEAKNILFLGVVGQRKGVYDLLQAVKQAEKQLPKDTKLVIYGPDYEKKIEIEIDLLALSHCVEYRGWLDAEQRAVVFRDTAVNVLPSYHEGLPMTILETMAWGIPNISTTVAAIPEAVDESNGILISPGDISSMASALVRLLNCDEERRQKSIEAYCRAASVFSVDTHMDRVLKIYRELCGKNV